MRTSRIIQVGPKSNDKCHYKRKAKKDWRHSQEHPVKTEAERRELCGQGMREATRIWKSQERVPTIALGGSAALLTP